MIDKVSAEGATTPETLRQKDRKGYETLESSGQIQGCSPKEQGRSRWDTPKSLRFQDSGGAGHWGLRSPLACRPVCVSEPK